MRNYSMSLYLTYWRPKVPKTTDKTEVTLKVDIEPGPASPAQKAAWHKFWQKLISEAKRER